MNRRLSPLSGRNAGLTTLEVLIASFLTALLGLAVMRNQASLSEAMEASRVQADALTEAEQALLTVTRELRAGTRTEVASPPNALIPASPANTTLTFYLPGDINGDGTIVDGAGEIEWVNGVPIVYAYNAGLQQLTRTAGGQTRVVANNVSSLFFEDRTINVTLNDDEVRIRLSIRKTTSRGMPIVGTVSGITQLRN